MAGPNEENLFFFSFLLLLLLWLVQKLEELKSFLLVTGVKVRVQFRHSHSINEVR